MMLSTRIVTYYISACA